MRPNLGLKIGPSEQLLGFLPLDIKLRRYDTQHDDIHPNDTQHNDIQHNDTQHYN
jgi:hypothetical protein